MTSSGTSRTPGSDRQRRPQRRTGALALAALALFMAGVVYWSFRQGGARCEVCITFRGLSQCRTVEGANRDEALSAATTNVCAYLASGVTDSIACTRTAPTRAACTD